MKKWQILTSKYLVVNRWLKLRKDKVKLPNGKVIDDYFIYETHPWLIIVAYTEDGRIIITRQYRHGFGDQVIEFPAGFLEEGEEPAAAVKRELLEETGYRAKQIEFVRSLTNNPSQIQETILFFRATGCVKVAEPKFDITEDIETILKTPAEVIEMIKNGQIIVVSSMAVGLLELLANKIEQ